MIVSGSYHYIKKIEFAYQAKHQLIEILKFLKCTTLKFLDMELFYKCYALSLPLLKQSMTIGVSELRSTNYYCNKKTR